MTKRLIEASDGDIGGGTRGIGCLLRGRSLGQLARSGGEVVRRASIRHREVLANERSRTARPEQKPDCEADGKADRDVLGAD